MGTRTFRVLGLGVIAVLLVLAVTSDRQVGFAQQASEMRWDIVAVLTFNPPTVKEGGATFASATDGSFIKLTGSGTFGPGLTNPATGGGTWETFTAYTVTGLVSFQESPGALPATFVDQIGTLANARAAKGTVTYFDRALTMPGVDANRTLFHRLGS